MSRNLFIAIFIALQFTSIAQAVDKKIRFSIDASYINSVFRVKYNVADNASIIRHYDPRIGFSTNIIAHYQIEASQLLKLKLGYEKWNRSDIFPIQMGFSLLWIKGIETEFLGGYTLGKYHDTYVLKNLNPVPSTEGIPSFNVSLGIGKRLNSETAKHPIKLFLRLSSYRITHKYLFSRAGSVPDLRTYYSYYKNINFGLSFLF